MFWLVLIFGTIITMSMILMTLMVGAYLNISEKANELQERVHENTLEVNEAQKKVYESYENLIHNQQSIINNPFNRH